VLPFGEWVRSGERSAEHLDCSEVSLGLTLRERSEAHKFKHCMTRFSDRLE
jgi:hypothetical protein